MRARALAAGYGRYTVGARRRAGGYRAGAKEWEMNKCFLVDTNDPNGIYWVVVAPTAEAAAEHGAVALEIPAKLARKMSPDIDLNSRGKYELFRIEVIQIPSN